MGTDYKSALSGFLEGQQNDGDLNDLLEAMKENRKVKIEILGNVSEDNSARNEIFYINGKEGTASQLQLLRAEQIRTFLIDNGINPRRLKIGTGRISLGSASASIRVIK